MGFVVKRANEQEQKPLGALIYGAPGTGKTYLAGSAARPDYQVLVLDLDKGALTIRHTECLVGECSSASDVADAWKLIAKGELKFDLLVLDHLTELQRFFIDAVKGKKSKLSMSDWGTVIDRTAQWVKRARDTMRAQGRDFLCLAHASEVAIETDEGTQLCVRPQMSGKALPGNICAMFDLVGHTAKYPIKGKKGEAKYGIQFAAANNLLWCKDRSKNLAHTEPNNWWTIRDKVFGAGVEE